MSTHKKHIIVTACAAALALSATSQAATVTFSDWDAHGFGDQDGSGFITQDGVTFNLEITVTGGNLNFNAALTKFGVGNTRVDVGETVTYTLSTIGASLDTLSLNTMGTSLFTNVANETVDFGDGVATQTVVQPSALNYTILTGLEALTADNIATWKLSTTPVVGDPGVTNVATSGSMDSISFDYVVAVPEPSSTALLGLGGLALIFRRRK